MEHQDWNPVVFRSKKALPTKTVTRSEANHGTPVKTNHATAPSPDRQYLSKLDRETEELKHQKLSLETCKQISRARMAKRMSQADLARAMNLPLSTIHSYENGKAIPDKALLSRIYRTIDAYVPSTGVSD